MAEDLNAPLDKSGIEEGLADIQSRTQQGFTGLQTSFDTQVPVTPQAPLFKADLPEVYEDVTGGRQSNDYKPPTKALDQALNAFAVAPVVAHNAARTAATGTFGTNRYHHNVARYKATPGDTYEKLGFSPWRDNEKYYDEHMSNWNDFRRATKAFWGNIVTGIESYNPFGLYEGGDKYKDIVTADKFAENTAVYQSRRQNGSAILGNAVGQSGLGVGMAVGFMAESLAITAVTGGLGMIPKLAKVPLQIQKARALGKAFSFANKYKKGTHVFETTKGANALRKLWKGTGSAAKWAGRTAFPHTAEWGKGIRTAEDVTNFMKGAKLFGSVYKDYAITAMAMAESKMEAGLNYQRLEGELLEEFRKRNGKDPSLSEWNEIQRMADLSATRVFQWNYPLIAATNFLVFGRLFKGMSKPVFGSLGQTIGKNSAGKVVYTKAAGAQVVGRLAGAKSIYGNAKTAIMTPKAWGKNIGYLGRGALTYTGANVGEGIQETLQEVISDTGSDYYKSVYWNKKGDPTIGNWMHMAYGNTVKYATTWEGFEIFASGFLMGGIMGGGTKAGTFVGQKSVQLGVAGKTYKEKFAKYQADKKKELQKLADGFNAVRKNLRAHYNPAFEEFAIQKQIKEEIDEAEEMEDKKGKIDLTERAFFEHIAAVSNSGRFDLIEDAIKDLNNLSIEEFNTANSTEFTTQDEVKKAVDDMLERAREINKNYSDVIGRYPNPHNPDRFKEGSKEFETEFHMQLAHNRFVKSMMLNRTKLNNAVRRKSELYNSLKKAPWWKFKATVESTVNVRNLEPMLDGYSMQEELRLLNVEISELEERGAQNLTPEQKTELKDKGDIRDLYRKFNDARERYKISIETSTPQHDSETNEVGMYSEEEIAEQEEALKLFHEAWVESIKGLSKSSGRTVNNQDVDDAFVGVKDMIELDADRFRYADVTNYLLSPEVYRDQIARGAEFNRKTFEAAREFFIKSINAHFEAQETSGFHQMLHAKNFILTAEGYDALFETAQMPAANQIMEFDREQEEQYGKPLEEGSPRHQEVTEMIKLFLEEVKDSGLKIKDFSEKLGKEIDVEIAKRALEDVEPTAPKELTMLDEGGNSNYNNWADVPGLQEEVQKIFAEKQAQREENPALEPFESIDDWIKSRPDALGLVLKKYNEQREAEHKKALEVYQQKQKEARETLKKEAEEGEIAKGKGRKQIEKAMGELEKATDPIKKLDIVQQIRNNIDQGAVLTKEELAKVDQIVEELKKEGYEIGTELQAGSRVSLGYNYVEELLHPAEDLPEGIAIIHRVAKPAIYLNGKLERKAHLDVMHGQKIDSKRKSLIKAKEDAEDAKDMAAIRSANKALEDYDKAAIEAWKKGKKKEKPTNVVKAYQGTKGIPEVRNHQYYTTDIVEGEDYGTVSTYDIDTTDFLRRKADEKEYNKLKAEFEKNTGLTFDINDNEPGGEGLKTQAKFFDFLAGKGYKGLDYTGYSDNKYIISFTKAAPTTVVIPPAPAVEKVPGVPAAVEKVLNVLQEKQKNAKKFSDLTEAEMKEYGVEENEHGYLIKFPDGAWKKVPSVTQTIGSTFITSVGNLVRLVKTQETGEVIEDPTTNPERATNNEDTDTYLVRLTESDKIVEVTVNDFDNITHDYSTISGSLVDEITRDYFGPQGVSEKAPAGIKESAYKKLIADLDALKAQFDKDDLIPISGITVDGKFKDIILYVTDAKGGPIAGAVDLLLYNPLTGKFYIYDMKTSKKKFWKVDPKDAGKFAVKGEKKAQPQLSPSKDTTMYENRYGLRRTTIHGYELQQSLYKNMFETMTGVPIGEQDTDGIALIPFVTDVNANRKSKDYAKVKDIEAESIIQLKYRDEVEQWVEKPKTKPLKITEEEGGIKPVQPEVLSGKKTEIGEIPELKKFTFDPIHAASILSKDKATTVRNPGGVPAEWIKIVNKEAHIFIKGERFLLKSLGQRTVEEAADLITKFAETDLNNIQLHQDMGLPGLPSGLSMNKETAQAIIDAKSPGAKLAISENLPTTLPESWKKGVRKDRGLPGEFTIDGTTYYSKFKGTANWLRGKGKMFVFVLRADPEGATVEGIDLDVSASKKYAARVTAIDDLDDLVALEAEISQWAVGLGSKVKDMKALEGLIEGVRERLKVDVSTKFNGLKVGDLLTIKSGEITNFAEVVRVTMLHSGKNYVVVENADNNNQAMKESTVSKQAFNKVVESVNAEGAPAPVEKSDIDATEDNVKSAVEMTPEAKAKVIEVAKDKSIDDLIDGSNDKIKPC